MIKGIGKYVLSVLLVAEYFSSTAQNNTKQFTTPPADWLVSNESHPATIERSKNGKDITLSNGLVKRTFRLTPNIACIDFINLSSGQQMLRAISPEASIVINGVSYNIGGLKGQTEKAYLLKEWPDQLKSDSNAFQFDHYEITGIPEYIHWKSRTWMTNKKLPTGKSLLFSYHSNLPALAGVMITVHYSLFDNIPLFCKSISLVNHGSKKIHVNQITNEILAAPEEEAVVDGVQSRILTQHGIYVENDYTFNGAMAAESSDHATNWETDTSYTSQVDYNFKTPCVIKVFPLNGMGIDLQPGDSVHSIRSFELLQEGYDRERNGLARKRMYRTVAPWVTANPIFMHLVSDDPVVIRAAVDQCAATGYEAIILSFGSGIDIEDTSAQNIQKTKALADYAHSRHILLGGYSLFSSRSISPEDDVISPLTGKPGGAFFGTAPCLGSKWGLAYIAKLKYFFEKTGFDILENDGPYPGDICASTTHPGHKNKDDSQWRQLELQKGLYHWMSEKGIYINAPDWYFLDGTNKTGVGYREDNFSLSREQQVILNRQNIYDGEWEKTPSMGWGFVPLTEYHGGGEAATLEPLHEHLETYEKLMMQYYGAGVQACYRGPRLYDTDSTRMLVTRVISWYKKYRDILNADIIHLRRPDGRDWDGIMHVSPSLKDRGLAMLYNPLKFPISRRIKIPLYYTGLKDQAVVHVKDGPATIYKLDRSYDIFVNVDIPAEGFTWLVIR